MNAIPVPVESRPWSPQDGPAPVVKGWTPGRRPALYVWDGRRWRYCVVESRHRYPDGRTVYQVLVGDAVRAYEWPQPGLRVAHPPINGPTGSTSIDSPNA